MIHATWGRIRAVYFLTPFPSSKKLVVRSTRNYALSWKVPEGPATFGADLDLCPIAEFSSGQFGPFPPPFARQFPGTFEKFPESLPARSARLHQLAAPLKF